MSRLPARETMLFAVVLAALAVGGGVAAASVVSADVNAAASSATPTASDVDAPENATIDYDGDRLNVDQARDQTISGTTTLEEGDQITVRVRSSDSENPFLMSTTARVTEGGDFSVEMAFDDKERGQEFTVSVHYNGTKLAQAPGVVGECDPACGDDAGYAGLKRNIWTATQGEAVTIAIELEGRESATLVFGSDAENVVLPVTVEDGNGDGEVVVRIETAVEDADDAGVSTAADADVARVRNGAYRPEAPLDAGEYPLELYKGASYQDEDPVDVGTLVLHEGTDDPETTRGNDGEETTTAGTIYGTAGTSVTGESSGFSLTTIGLLGLGGVLAVLGIVALVGGLD